MPSSDCEKRMSCVLLIAGLTFYVVCIIFSALMFYIYAWPFFSGSAGEVVMFPDPGSGNETTGDDACSQSINSDGLSSFSFSRFAVVTNARECSCVGKRILDKPQSTAVDAAIASLLCVGIVNMHSTGIGGGGHVVLQ